MIHGPRGSSGREGGLFPVKEASQVLDLKAPRGAFIFWAPGRGGFDQGGPSWPFFITRIGLGVGEGWTMATAAAIRDKLIGLLEPLIERLGYELVDIEWVSVPRSGVLRIFIDQPPEKGGHIGVEDCETVSREVSALLDVEDPISGAYNLEVSSPGFDRVLRKPAHFGRFLGARVWVELKVPREGRRRYTGDLSEVDESGCIVMVDGQPVRIGFAEIGKARLVA